MKMYGYTQEVTHQFFREVCQNITIKELIVEKSEGVYNLWTLEPLRQVSGRTLMQIGHVIWLPIDYISKVYL